MPEAAPALVPAVESSSSTQEEWSKSSRSLEQIGQFPLVGIVTAFVVVVAPKENEGFWAEVVAEVAVVPKEKAGVGF